MASNFQEVHEELLEKFDRIEGEYQAQGDEQDSLARMEIRYSGNTKYEKLQDGKALPVQNARSYEIERPFIDISKLAAVLNQSSLSRGNSDRPLSTLKIIKPEIVRITKIEIF